MRKTRVVGVSMTDCGARADDEKAKREWIPTPLHDHVRTYFTTPNWRVLQRIVHHRVLLLLTVDILPDPFTNGHRRSLELQQAECDAVMVVSQLVDEKPRNNDA